MFDDERSDEVVALVHVGTSGGVHEWRETDRALKRVVKARGRLDGEELLWLARAERAEIHRHFGHATILEYVERVMGYGPRVARERLRVARALESLPRLREELESARLSYSAVREVSRVATPWNEEKWIRRVEGLSLREIEEALAGREEGDDPEDEPKPDVALRPITFDLTPRTLALFRAASRSLEDEVGHPLTDDEIIGILCASALTDRRPAFEDPPANEVEDTTTTVPTWARMTTHRTNPPPATTCVPTWARMPSASAARHPRRIRSLSRSACTVSVRRRMRPGGRSMSRRRRSSRHCAMRSSSGAWTWMFGRARRATFHRRPRERSGGEMVGGASCQGADRHGTSKCITSCFASRAEITRWATSRACAGRTTPRCMKDGCSLPAARRTSSCSSGSIR
jgi:hypothetical protein